MGGNAAGRAAEGARRGGERLDGGDHDRRHSSQSDGAGRRAPVSRDRGQRLGHQASVRQPVRHRAVDPRRHRARDEPAARGEHGGGGGVWVVRSRIRAARARRRGERRRDGDRPAQGARGSNGRLSCGPDGRGRPHRGPIRDARRQRERDPAREHAGDEGRRRGRELGPLQRGDRLGEPEAGGARPDAGARVRRGVAARREADLRARRWPADQPRGGRGASRERDGHVVRQSGARRRVRRAAGAASHEGRASHSARARCRDRASQAAGHGRDHRYTDTRAEEVSRVVGDGHLTANVIQVRVAHLGLDRTTNTPVVILQEQEGERVLPIWIGPAEASAIAMELAGVKFARPLTHDLLKQVILGLGADLRKVIITQVKDNTYYAELHIYRGDAVIQIDARPSDSIAVALGGGGQPIDSTRTDARGAYALPIRRPDSAAIYVVSTWHAGIAYFSEPIAPGRSTSGLRTLYVYDTSSTGPAVRVMRRLVTVVKEKRDGSRDVLELVELENPGVATRVARDTVRPTWAGAIPPVAIQFRVGQGDVSPQVVTRRGDSVAVYGPLPPGERKQLSYTYVLSATVRRVSLPIDQPTNEVDLLLEDTTA